KFEPQIAPARQPILERRQGVGAVAVHVAVIPVVQAENVAGEAAVTFAWRQFPASILGDRIHAFDQPFRRLHAPIAGDASPHHGPHSLAIHDLAQPWTAKAKRRPEPTRLNSGGQANRIGATLQLRLTSPWPHQNKWG